MYNIYIIETDSWKAVQKVGVARDRFLAEEMVEHALVGLDPMRYTAVFVEDGSPRDEELKDSI